LVFCFEIKKNECKHKESLKEGYAMQKIDVFRQVPVTAMAIETTPDDHSVNTLHCLLSDWREDFLGPDGQAPGLRFRTEEQMTVTYLSLSREVAMRLIGENVLDDEIAETVLKNPDHRYNHKPDGVVETITTYPYEAALPRLRELQALIKQCEPIGPTESLILRFSKE
jgi:hypothetical protein